MSPESRSAFSSLQFTNKVPLSFDGYGYYQQYREIVVLLDTMTSVAAPRRAPTILAQVNGQARVTRKLLPLKDLTSESGVTSVHRELDKTFGLDTVTLLHDNISDFFDYNWDKHLLVEEFFVAFHSCLGKISKLDMNDELKEHLYLEQASLDSHNRSFVVGAAGSDYSLQLLVTSLKNAFCTEAFFPASMNTNTADYRQRRATSVQPLYDLRSACNFKGRTSPSALSPEGTLFQIYLSSDKSNDTSSATIDSWSCCLVAGKETLDQIMQILGIDRLKDEPIDKQKHSSGPSNKPMWTLWAVGVPLECNIAQGNRTVEFLSRFDVIEGRLSILIGLPYLLAIKESLNFRYNNLSIVIHQLAQRF